MIDNALQLTSILNPAQVNPKYKPNTKLKLIRTNDQSWTALSNWSQIWPMFNSIRHAKTMCKKLNGGQHFEIYQRSEPCASQFDINNHNWQDIETYKEQFRMLDSHLHVANPLNHAQVDPKYKPPFAKKLKRVRTKDQRWPALVNWPTIWTVSKPSRNTNKTIG